MIGGVSLILELTTKCSRRRNCAFVLQTVSSCKLFSSAGSGPNSVSCARSRKRNSPGCGQEASLLPTSSPSSQLSARFPEHLLLH